MVPQKQAQPKDSDRAVSNTECQHNFGTLRANFVKNIYANDPENVSGFELHIQSQCGLCGQRFKFHSLPVGSDAQEGATISADGYTIHLPMQPEQALAFAGGVPMNN